MVNFLLSVIASLLAVAVIFLSYLMSAKSCEKEKAYALCQWLPGWNCFRLVVQNMYSQSNVYSIRYHAWLRSILPKRDGCLVSSYKDQTEV